MGGRSPNPPRIAAATAESRKVSINCKTESPQVLYAAALSGFTMNYIPDSQDSQIIIAYIRVV